MNRISTGLLALALATVGLLATPGSAHAGKPQVRAEVNSICKGVITQDGVVKRVPRVTASGEYMDRMVVRVLDRRGKVIRTAKNNPLKELGMGDLSATTELYLRPTEAKRAAKVVVVAVNGDTRDRDVARFPARLKACR